MYPQVTALILDLSITTHGRGGGRWRKEGALDRSSADAPYHVFCTTLCVRRQPKGPNRTRSAWDCGTAFGSHFLYESYPNIESGSNLLANMRSIIVGIASVSLLKLLLQITRQRCCRGQNSHLDGRRQPSRPKKHRRQFQIWTRGCCFMEYRKDWRWQHQRQGRRSRGRTRPGSLQ